MVNFKKLAELSPEDRSLVKDFWKDLYGDQYANAMVEDYTPDGKKKEVKASKDSFVIKKVNL